MILFQPDLDDFTASDRNMYFNLRASPYPRAETEEALYDMLTRLPELAAACPEILKFYGATEMGRSAEAVARWIAQRC